MEESDYFRSPHHRNIMSFCSPLDALQNLHGNEGGLFQNNLFSPDRRNYQSPFLPYNQHQDQISEEEEQNSNSHQKPKLISNLIDFEKEFDDNQQKNQELIENLEQFNITTPKKANTKLDYEDVKTTDRKKYQLRPFYFQQKHNISRFSERGLRGLSKQAFQVLKTSEPLTYQEVAQKIIDENDQYGESSNKKQSQGIKRRVYDALNVLIAAGLLNKNGRKIYYIKKSEAPSKKNTDIKKAVDEKIEFRKMTIAIKKAELQRFKKQAETLKKLVQRNIIEECSGIKVPEKIHFPFIVVSGFQQGHSRSSPQTKVFKQFLSGDLDAISNIDFLQQN